MYAVGVVVHTSKNSPVISRTWIRYHKGNIRFWFWIWKIIRIRTDPDPQKSWLECTLLCGWLQHAGTGYFLRTLSWELRTLISARPCEQKPQTSVILGLDKFIYFSYNTSFWPPSLKFIWPAMFCSVCFKYLTSAYLKHTVLVFNNLCVFSVI